jgi:hypothetical protein
MPKKVSKPEVVREINKLDVLQLIQEYVQRSEPAPQRRSKIQRLVGSIQELADDERDVLIIAIQIK